METLFLSKSVICYFCLLWLSVSKVCWLYETMSVCLDNTKVTHISPQYLLPHVRSELLFPLFLSVVHETALEISCVHELQVPLLLPLSDRFKYFMIMPQNHCHLITKFSTWKLWNLTTYLLTVANYMFWSTNFVQELSLFSFSMFLVVSSVWDSTQMWNLGGTCTSSSQRELGARLKWSP